MLVCLSDYTLSLKNLTTTKIHTSPSYTKNCLVIWLSLGGVLPQQCYANLSYLFLKILSRHSKHREIRQQNSEIKV
jgi:hypothetical protein